MIQTKCIKKFRDKQNKIYGYRLIDLNGKTQDVTPGDLKRAMKNNQINVINLTLTSDGRLIDKKPENQLQNKKIMPNKVVKPQTSNDKLFELLEKCANRIAVAMTGKNTICCIDKDTSITNYVSARFELIDGIIYKGTERHLDLTIDLNSKDTKCVWIGLLDMEEFNTEADKKLVIKNKINTNEILAFVDRYIEYLKKLNSTKYKVMFESLMLLEELDEDIENITGDNDSNVKVIEIPNNVSVDAILEGESSVGVDVLDDYLYPYMCTDDTHHIVNDLEKHFIIAFVKDGYSESTLFYSVNKEKCIYELEGHFRINKSKCNECEYSEKVIGMLNSEYVGYAYDKQPIQKIETMLQKREDTILIKVSKVNSVDTNDDIEFNKDDSKAEIASISSSYKRPYDSESYTEFIKSLTSLMEKTFGFNNDKEKLKFGSFKIDPNTKDILWLSGVMGDFIYDGNKCYIEIDYTYDVDSKDGVILFDVMVHDGDGIPQYTFKYEFDSLNMKAHFSKILKETQQFIYHVKNNWKH